MTPHLKADELQRSTAERAHGLFAQNCPIYRSLYPQIAISTRAGVRAAG